MLNRWTAARYTALAGWLAIWAVPAFTSAMGRITDWDVARGGGYLLTGQMPAYHVAPLHLYGANPQLLIGPPALAVNGATQWLFGHSGDAAVMVLICALGLATVAAAELFARTVNPARVPAVMAGAVVLLPLWGKGFGENGHLEDAAAIFCVVLAAALLARRQVWVPALLIGFATACKPWAVVAVVLLAFVPSAKRLRAFGLVVGMALVWWAPFLLADPHTTDVANTAPRLSWNSLPHLLGWPLSPDRMPAWTRSAQTYLALAAAVGVTWRRGVYAGLLAGFGVRVALDPIPYTSYYAAAPVAVAILLDVTSDRRWPVWSIGTAGLLGFAPMWGQSATGWLMLAWLTAGATALLPRVGLANAPAATTAGASG